MLRLTGRFSEKPTSCQIAVKLQKNILKISELTWIWQLQLLRLPLHQDRSGEQWTRAAEVDSSFFFNLSSPLPGRLLNHLADLMERDKDQLAGLDTLDNGKPLSSAVEDVEQSISTFQWDL